MCNTQADGYVCYTVCAPAYCLHTNYGISCAPASSCTQCVATSCIAGYCNCYINASLGCLKDWGANPTSPYIVETEFKVPSLYTGCTDGWLSPNRPCAFFNTSNGTCERCDCPDIGSPIASGYTWVYTGVLPQHVYSQSCSDADGCYDSLVIMESNNATYNAFPSVTHCTRECFGCSGGVVMYNKPLQNRMWCCDYAQDANPTGWMSNYFAVKAARACGTITNISGSTLTVTLYARANDCNYNYCYCSLVSCSLAAGGYWNYDVTYCNIMQAAACYAYGQSPYGSNALWLCITPYVGSAQRVEVYSNFSYCVNRNNDLYVGVGYGTL